MARWFALDYCVTGSTAATRVRRKPGDLFEADAVDVGDLPDLGLIREAPADDPADDAGGDDLPTLGDIRAGNTDPVRGDDPPPRPAPEEKASDSEEA